MGARAGSGTLDFGLYDIDVQGAPVKASKQWGLTGLSGAVGEVSFYE